MKHENISFKQQTAAWPVKIMLILFYKFEPIHNYVAACIIAYLGEVTCTTRRFLSTHHHYTLLTNSFVLLSAFLLSSFFGNLP